MNVKTLIQYDESIVKVDPGNGDSSNGQHFRAPGSANKFMAFGCAPYGGRTEHGGPIDATPRAFVYGCATVISADGNGMSEYRDSLELRPGDIVFVKGYGFHECYHGGVGRNHLKIRPCDPPAEYQA